MNLPPHPRLLVGSSTWQDLQDKQKRSPTLNRFLKKLENEGRVLLEKPPVQHRLQGFRLLSVAREALRRIVLWSFNYRVTGDQTFKERAESEMLAVANFPDWNPQHFLDVGEMATAVAIGYDWLYDELPITTRTKLREAIIEKGLKPGLDPQAPTNWWYTHESNWNLVCIAGLVLGAFCVAEHEPKLMKQILALARTYNPHGLRPYAPDGVYPEGPGYWGYGTTYQIILLAALESALGTDWDLTRSPGFCATADYPQRVTGPTDLAYNYSDSGEAMNLEPALFWLARYFGKSEILYYQRQYLARFLEDKMPPRTDITEDRFLPLLAIWAENLEEQAPPVTPLNWHGDGIVPLAVFRSSWSDPDALFLAVKGGAASVNHGHMDAGSFILDADGVRWARDLGAQGYHTLESKGVAVWNNAQDGGRWNVFRLNNFSHSTLTINGQLHRVKGRAEIIRYSGDSATPHVVLDLTPVFAGQAGRVVRGFKILPDRHILIQDELSGLKPNDLVRWALVTPAAVSVQDDKAVLQKESKTMHAVLTSPSGGKFEVIPADPPQDDFNAPNPGISILIANFRVPVSGNLLIQVLLRPGEVPSMLSATALAPGEEWSLPLFPKTP